MYGKVLSLYKCIAIESEWEFKTQTGIIIFVIGTTPALSY